MKLKISDYKLLCNIGSADYNEDIIGLSPYGTWVLDGATGLNNKNLVSNESDANWFVNRWNTYLHDNIKNNDSLRNIIRNGIDEIKSEYMNLVSQNKIEPLDFPSCAATILKFHEDKIEYILLGDCTLFYKTKDLVKVYKDTSLDYFDKIVYDKMANIENGEQLTLNEKKSILMPTIISNRLKKNKHDGYWVLEFSKDALENCISGFIEIEDKIELMIMSDGFSCAYDKYNLYTKEEMMDIAKDKGIDYIYNKIRNIEKEDELSVKFPRFKIHDDSSCIYLDIYRNK